MLFKENYSGRLECTKQPLRRRYSQMIPQLILRWNKDFEHYNVSSRTIRYLFSHSFDVLRFLMVEILLRDYKDFLLRARSKKSETGFYLATDHKGGIVVKISF